MTELRAKLIEAFERGVRVGNMRFDHKDEEMAVWWTDYILEAISAAGMVIVMREPTEAMLDAAHSALLGATAQPEWDCWQAMVEAAEKV